MNSSAKETKSHIKMMREIRKLQFMRVLQKLGLE